MSVAVAESLDYSPKQINAGSYNLRLLNTENSSTATIAPSSTVNVDFLLPNQVINLYKSFLNFDLSGQEAKTNRLWTAFHSGLLAPIDGLILSTASGVRLAEINNIPQYTKMCFTAMTSHDDFETMPKNPSDGTQTVAAVKESGQLFNKAMGGAANIGAASFPASVAEFQYGAFVCSSDSATVQWTAEEYPYDAAVNYIVDTASADGTNARTPTIRIRLPLKLLYGSIFAIDKDLYFGEQLRLTVRFNQGAKMGWTVTSDGTNDKYYGAQASGADNAFVSADLAAAPKLSNLNLRIAVETDEGIVQTIKSRFAGEGIKINFPYIYSWQAATTGSGQDSFIRKLNRGHGSHLLRMVCGLFGAVQTGAAYCNYQNFTYTQAAGYTFGSKWSSYRPYLDSKPLTDDWLTVSDQLAFMYNQEMLKGSCIKGNKAWNTHPTIIQDFAGVGRSIDMPKMDSYVSGLDLSAEHEFMIQFNTTVANQMCYMFAVCSKTLVLNAAGVSVM